MKRIIILLIAALAGCEIHDHSDPVQSAVECQCKSGAECACDPCECVDCPCKESAEDEDTPDAVPTDEVISE